MTGYLQQKTLFAPQIFQQPSLNLGMVIVIPCYNEPQALTSLISIKKSNLPKCSVEVIVVVNHGEQAHQEIININDTTYHQLTEWSEHNNSAQLKFHILYHNNLPKKHAGVGLARKIGMDEACWRLERAEAPNGIIACFDADSHAQPNYLTALYNHFHQNPSSVACSIHYEHPTEGLEFSDETYEAIIQYELHLRYYVNAQRYAKFPFAFQTIGSSMAVRASAYQKQGGMNKRKAGEDFYFLHKFIESGNFTELTTTTVIPSPRPSDRVPFGTGKAVAAHLYNKVALTSYSMKSFEELKYFFESFTRFYQKPYEMFLRQQQPALKAFLPTVKAEDKWEELHQHTSDLPSFQKRFFRWFNAFTLMKYIHYARDNFYPDTSLLQSSIELLAKLNYSLPQETHLDHLITWRKLDKS